VSTAELTCPRCASEVEPEDLRCAICGHACPAAAPEDHEQTLVEVLRCSGCGVALSYDVDAGAPRCAFCGSVLTVEVPDDPVDQAHHLAPFTVDRDHAEAAFRSWLAGLGWFRPSDLMSGAQLETIRPLWWVAWINNAEALVTWAADSDHGAGKADWAPHAGRTAMTFSHIAVPASRGLTETEAAALIGSYDLSSSLPTSDAHDAAVERFELPRSAARRHLLAALERVARHRLQHGHIPGRRLRNLHTSLVLRRLRTRRWGLPAWILAYRYRDRLYRAVLSGQDPATLVGEAPYSTLKILAAIVGGGIVLAFLLAVAGGASPRGLTRGTRATPISGQRYRARTTPFRGAARPRCLHFRSRRRTAAARPERRTAP
jgi:hypothetical protein